MEPAVGWQSSRRKHKKIGDGGESAAFSITSSAQENSERSEELDEYLEVLVLQIASCARVIPPGGPKARRASERQRASVWRMREPVVMEPAVGWQSSKRKT